MLNKSNEKIQTTTDQEEVEDTSSFSSKDSIEKNGRTLKRGLKARHIQMIALGGTIGTQCYQKKRRYTTVTHL